MGDTSLARTVLKWLGIFVVSTAGVFVGMTLSVKYTGARGGGKVVLPADLRNSTSLEVGRPMPPVQAFHADGESVDLKSVLVGRKTILGFVSHACGPCRRFTRFLEGSELLASEGYQTLLLVVEPEDNPEDYVLPAFRISKEMQSELAIDIVPTMIGIGEDGTIQFIACGFNDDIDDSYIEAHL